MLELKEVMIQRPILLKNRHKIEESIGINLGIKLSQDKHNTIKPILINYKIKDLPIFLERRKN